MGLPPQWCRALFMCAEDPMVSWHPTSLFQHPPPPTEQESNQKDNEMSFLNDFYVLFWVMFLFSFFPTGAFFSLLPLSSLSPFPTGSDLLLSARCQEAPLLSSTPAPPMWGFHCCRPFFSFFYLFFGLWSHQ